MKFPSLKKSEKPQKVAAVVHEDGRRDFPKASSKIMVSMEDKSVIRIGKKRYAVDLLRRIPTDGDIKQEASKLGSFGLAQNWNVYARTSDGRLAFGSPDLGHKKGQLPLAESLRSDLLGDSWIVAVKLEQERFWVGKKQNGTIEFDEVLQTEDLARSQIISDKVSPDRPIIAPASWNIPGSSEAEIQDLVGEKTPALRKFTFLANHAQRLFFLFLILIVGGGTYLYFRAKEAQRIAEERELAQRREKRILVNDSDFPWFEKVRPEVFLSSCARIMAASSKSVPGWTAEPPVCQYSNGNIGVTHLYTRTEGGRIAWLRDVFSDQVGTVTLGENGNSATYTYSEALAADRALFNRNAPWTAENIDRVLRERFQNLGLEPRLESQVSRTPTNKVDKPVFNHATLGISTTFFPSEIAGLLADIPAVVPETLVWDTRANTWTFDVKVYHPAILPIGAI